MAKSNGQVLIEKIEAWIGGYMAFGDPTVALVLALWSIHTWVTERFEATPYLSITAPVPAAGKTRLLTLLSWLSRKGQVFADLSPAYMYTWMAENDSKVTILIDESEKLSSSALGVLRSLMNSGYLQGQTIGRKMGKHTEDFPCFCPKVFAGIGDVNPILRSRSIVINLEPGKPARELKRVVGMAEAAGLRDEIRHAFVNGWPEGVSCDWMVGREREIWASLFGVAVALGLDKATMARLTRCASDLIAAKGAPLRRYEAAEDLDKANDNIYAARALKDLLAIFREGDKVVFSAVAVERMKEIAEGPWRLYKGQGLTVEGLAGLVSRFDVGPEENPLRMGVGRKAPQGRGYKLARVRPVAEKYEAGV